MIVYVIQKLGVMRVLQLSQRNGKLPLSRRKQDNYPVIYIYASEDTYSTRAGYGISISRHLMD